MTETIWLAIISVLLTIIIALGAVAYRTLIKADETLTKSFDATQRRIGQVVAVMIALVTDLPPEKRDLVMKAMQVLVTNGRD